MKAPHLRAGRPLSELDGAIDRRVLDAVKRFAATDDKKPRYFDLSLFERIEPFMNWQQLLEDNRRG